jgi:hypothetical protein
MVMIADLFSMLIETGFANFSLFFMAIDPRATGTGSPRAFCACKRVVVNMVR